MATKIEWCGETWNPITGCTPVSAGCKNCYAARMARRLAGRVGYPKDEPFRPGVVHDTAYKKIESWKKPRLIFVCSMGDLFHDGYAFNQIYQVFRAIEKHKHHTFMVLTKRPELMLRLNELIHFSELSNLWLGVTAENQLAADSRVQSLLSVRGVARKFLSVEPMLGEIKTYKFIFDIDWVVCGGETGPNARPVQEGWVKSLMLDCAFLDIPFFFKKWNGKDGHLINGKEVRQVPFELQPFFGGSS